MNKHAELIISAITRNHVVPALVAANERTRIKAVFLINGLRTEYFVQHAEGHIEFGSRADAIQFRSLRDSDEIRALVDLLASQASALCSDEAALVGVELETVAQ